MKKLLYIISVFIIFDSCGDPAPSKDSEVGEILSRNHSLVELKTIKADSTISGKHYFAIAGENLLVFSWKLKDGSSITSELPLSNVRIQFSEDTEVPYVKFRWIRGEETNIYKVLSQYS